MIAAIGVHLSYPLAVAAGLASFLSPCVFPLVPAYLAFLAGRAGRPALVAAAAGTSGGAPSASLREEHRLPVLGNGLAFVAGFSAVFITFFYLFSALDVTLLRTHQRLVNLVGGLIVIVLALEVLGVLRFGFLMRERRLRLLPTQGGMVPAFLLGSASPPAGRRASDPSWPPS